MARMDGNADPIPQQRSGQAAAAWKPRPHAPVPNVGTRQPATPDLAEITPDELTYRDGADCSPDAAEHKARNQSLKVAQPAAGKCSGKFQESMHRQKIPVRYP